MLYPIVLSYVQAEALLTALKQGRSEVQISPDLGISMVTVKLSEAGVRFPQGEHLNWTQVARIAKAKTNCFIVEPNATTSSQVPGSVAPLTQPAEPVAAQSSETGGQEADEYAHLAEGYDICAIQFFSHYTNRMCSLVPTRRTPTMLIAGFTMHRIVDIDPMEDTHKKVATIAPITGRMLDTATGLGYTAIVAARTAEHVITIELDPGAQEIARLNPWSRNLFTNPAIEQIMGNACDIVPTFADESFDRIVHDPPVFSLAGELYSGEFYGQLYRVLKRRGRMFHYIGNLESKANGAIARGALKRLQEAGFARVVRHPEAFGVVAYK